MTTTKNTNTPAKSESRPDKDGAEAAPAKARKTDMCKMSSRVLKLAPEERNHWCVTPPAGASLDAMKNPASWAILARSLRPRDRLEIMPECGSWMAEAVVLRTTDIAAHIFVLNHWELTEAEHEDDDEYEVRWQSPATKFAVFRKSDNEVVKNGFETKDDAERWRMANCGRRAA